MESIWTAVAFDSLSIGRSALLLLASVSLPLIAAFVYRASRKSYGNAKQAVPTTQEKPKAQDKQREWGEWSPVNFSYPPVTPSALPPTELKPIPYRPFRWGAYHVTMGIRDMAWDEWIELDDQLSSYYYIKKHRIATRGTNVVRVLPDRPGVVKSASQAAIELVHELADYLSKRYPETFTVSRSAWGHISSVTIGHVNDTLDLPPPLVTKGTADLRTVSIEEAEHAMKVSALMIQDDLALMMEGTNGMYYFQGGAVCVPGFWRMRDKIGMSLEEIHIEGHVPQYETKLHHSMDRYFKRMPVEKPILRNNYFFQVIPPASSRHTATPTTQQSVPPTIANDGLVDPEELGWSSTTNGNEESFVHGHPITPDTPPVVAAENLRLRTERQSLRRLPLSGAIVFTIRTYLFPVEELAKEPGIPARMASALRSWTEDVVRYKGNGLYEKVLLEYLDRKAEEQRVLGGEEMVRDPGRGYPY